MIARSWVTPNWPDHSIKKTGCQSVKGNLQIKNRPFLQVIGKLREGGVELFHDIIFGHDANTFGHHLSTLKILEGGD